MTTDNARPIYVIGHKNPDADAICSAVTYAHYKNTLTKSTTYIPARCGNSNLRINAIFEYFQTPLPTFISDVSIRAQDIMCTDLLKLHTHNTCAQALKLIDQHDIRALPVVDNNNILKGTLSIFQLGEFFAPFFTGKHPAQHVHASIKSICSTLNAEPLHLIREQTDQSFRIRIAAMDLGAFEKFVCKDTPPEKTIVVVGDRHDIQELSIRIKVRLLVITGNLKPSPSIIKAAKCSQTSIIISPYDTATTATALRTATALESIMDKDAFTFCSHESLHSIQRKINKLYISLFCVVDENQKLLGVFSKSDLLVPPKKNIILVDHNELAQAVDGAQEANILEIIDHHRLNSPTTIQPIHMRNEVIGSTCSIIAELFKQNHVSLKPEIAGLLMAGIISDTLNLQSPTTTKRDEIILPWLSKKANIKTEKLVKLIFHSGSIILNTPPEDLITLDCKHYEQNNICYSASQVEELGFSNFNQKQVLIFQALQEYRTRKNLTLSVILITDINLQDSLLLVDGSEDILESISYQRIKKSKNIFELPGIVSRKKQLIPYLSNLLDDLV